MFDLDISDLKLLFKIRPYILPWPGQNLNILIYQAKLFTANFDFKKLKK